MGAHGTSAAEAASAALVVGWAEVATGAHLLVRAITIPPRRTVAASAQSGTSLRPRGRVERGGLDGGGQIEIRAQKLDTLISEIVVIVLPGESLAHELT